MKLKTKTKELIWCIILILGLILFFATGCKTVKPVIVEKTKTEYRDRYVRDSVFYRDTTHIRTLGDTVFVDVVRWRERFKLDTLYHHRVDSIPVIVEVPFEINRLTWWQQTRLKALNFITVAFLILVVILFIRR